MKLYLLLFAVLSSSTLVCASALTVHEHEHHTACQKVKALVALPQQSNPQTVEWTPFIDNILLLLDGHPEYEALCEDLKTIRAPRGFRALKLICIARRLNNHQELFKKMCEREEPLSFREGRQIAKYIRF